MHTIPSPRYVDGRCNWQYLPDTRVTTSLTEIGNEFLVWLPTSKPPYTTGFRQNFESMFPQPNEKAGGFASQNTDKIISSTMNKPQRVPIQTAGGSSAAVVTRLPDLNTLARPEILFGSQAPYYIIVKNIYDAKNIRVQEKIVVQASHPPSLELLNGYLDKYKRRVVHDVRKVRRCDIEFLFCQQPSRLNWYVLPGCHGLFPSARCNSSYVISRTANV